MADLKRVWELLPDKPMDMGELNRALCRILGLPADTYEWDARLSGERSGLFAARLVVRDAKGRLVKGELPPAKTFAEANDERIAAIARQERERFFGAMRPPGHWDGTRVVQRDDPEHPANRVDPAVEAAFTRLIAPFEARLEAQIAELRELVEAQQAIGAAA